ncbi:MAG: DNA polymerase III subunit gamma/tau [Eggerthellaceae bacterium]
MEALYRKYRPSTFSDVVGQEHIERTLKNAIEQAKVSHAYLFCGPRGTGKTTMARILSKALLCDQGPTAEPDGTCPECQAIAQGTHPDVYELDAASRTGVDNVREEIISRVNYAPTQGTWKVYIIDEVHMLSPAAFNALLKTLEEPPAHVVFILCTTDPQKVPETIQSRCQRFDFHRISAESIVSRLGAICVKEGVDFEGEALDLIAYRSDGGMRNALTSLEQLMAFGGGHVTLEGAQNMLGSLDESDLSEIVVAIGKRDTAACFNWVARYVETGADLAQFVRDLAEHIRNMYLLSMAGAEVEVPVSEVMRRSMVDQLSLFGRDRLARLLSVLGDLSQELRSSSNPRLSFEIALTRMVRPESDMTLEALAERIEQLERTVQALAVEGTAGGALPRSSAMATPIAPSQFGEAEQVVAPQALAPAQSEPMVSPYKEPAVQASTPAVYAQPPAQPAPSAQPQVQPSARSAAPTRPAAPSAVPAQPAVQHGAPTQPAAPVQPVASTVAAAPNATRSTAVDLSNPAAIQRFWHSVTSSLRKTNPARGVLFMNAKVSAQPDGSGLAIEFSKDNSFAYTAAQKPEVQQLLSQTMQSIAGEAVSYRLVIAGDGSIGASVAPAPQSTPVRPVVSRPVAQGVSGQSAPEATQPVSGQSAPAATQETPAPMPMTQPLASVSPRTQTNAPAAMSAAPDDDQVPLDVYDSMAPVDEYDESEPEPSPASARFAPRTVDPSTRSQPMASQLQPTSSPSQPVPPQPEPAVQAPLAPDQASRSQSQGGDESGQIVEILSNTFGEGIKFEELSD